MDRAECIVAGAGVVGLAIARAIAMAGREVIVVEAAGDIGTGTSSRNSEVIHAGIYYPAGSAMARLCVAGRQMLYRYCEDHGVPHRRCGKFIVATGIDDPGRLVAIRARAEANGVDDLVLLSAAEARAKEPALNCTGALHSPSTGIVDSHALMLALRGDAEQAGTAFAFHAPFVKARRAGEGFAVEIGGDAPMTLGCDLLINAAGLHAPDVARSIEGLPREHIPTAYYAKGNYFACTVRVPFSHLIYPLPEPGGLGVHLTLDIGGAGRFGPDVEWVKTLNYDVDPSRAARFYPAIRRYWPDLPDGALASAYSGIRPKIVPQGAPAQDFMIQDARRHGVPGLVNLFGIESPGLTASLAIAEEVRVLTAPR
ncbi:L-2-hydroxyglutarate oxidase LhgO OS=Afipia felis OX=1035 GN=lhgO_1 PE=3 SV=1 [Afipia felis]